MAGGKEDWRGVESGESIDGKGEGSQEGFQVTLVMASMEDLVEEEATGDTNDDTAYARD